MFGTLTLNEREVANSGCASCENSLLPDGGCSLKKFRAGETGGTCAQVQFDPHKLVYRIRAHGKVIGHACLIHLMGHLRRMVSPERCTLERPGKRIRKQITCDQCSSAQVNGAVVNAAIAN